MIIARMFLENCLLAIYLDRIFGMVNSREQQLASIFLIEVSMHALLQYLGKDVLISVLELFDFAHISLMTLKSFNKDHSDGWIRLLNSFLIMNFLDKFKTFAVINVYLLVMHFLIISNSPNTFGFVLAMLPFTAQTITLKSIIAMEYRIF